MLDEFICPDGTKIKVKECFRDCPKKQRCVPLPVLYRLGKTRDRSKMGGLFSVTEIINPFRYTYISLLYPYAESPLDGIWKVLGSAGHYFLDQDFEYVLTEERLSNGLWTGQIDAYTEGGVLYDYKFVSVWKTANWQPLPRDPWTIQLNAYRELLENAGFSVKEMRVVLFSRDWRKWEAKREDNYPAPLVEIVVPKVNVRDFMLGRIMLLYWFLGNRILPPYCDEVWKGEAPYGKRCEEYCSVKEVCRQAGDGFYFDARIKGASHERFGWN